jgi:hypothetical protein
MRDDDCLYLDGVKYEIEKIGDDDKQTGPYNQLEPPKDFYKEIEDICTQIKNKQNGLALNMFYNPRDKKDICEFVEKLNKEIAITRVEISKTLPDNL